MIFLGDVACPEERLDTFRKWTAEQEVFGDEVVVLNLEAAIVDDSAERKNLTLYNVGKFSECFPQAKKVIVSLANNHMYDYPEKIVNTKHYLECHGIDCFGLYDGGRIIPYEFEEQGIKYALFGHCWRLYTHTNCNDVNDVQVVDCLYDEFVEIVRNYVNDHSDTFVYCFMHWNYDLEQLPLPMQRRLSRELIDVGVSGVIGSHSHRPQGMEIYREKPIAYCLGNFYLPSGTYFSGKLTFPECAKTTYGVKISDNSMETLWFKTDVSEMIPLIFETREPFAQGEKSKEYSPFRGMNDSDYLKFFTKNRAKKMLVAKFGEPYGKQYLVDETWAINRVKVLRKIKGLLGK